MQTQHFSNHSRYVPLYHFVAGSLLLAATIGSFINLSNANGKGESIYSASLICVICIVLILLFWFARAFAIKAQDRAIRAEENLRHFILTGKPLDSRLTVSQIVALRFAPDEEFPSLAQQAMSGNMSSKQIKQAVKNWKADCHRV